MLIHADLFVASMTKSLEFYVETLGATLVDDTVVHGALVHYLSKGRFDRMKMALLKIAPVGAFIELMQFEGNGLTTAAVDEQAPHATPAGSLTIMVGDLASHMATLRSKGIDPASEVFTVDTPRFGRTSIVYYTDPDGHLIEFLQIHDG